MRGVVGSIPTGPIFLGGVLTPEHIKRRGNALTRFYGPGHAKAKGERVKLGPPRKTDLTFMKGSE